MDILFTEPIYKDYIWGGYRLKKDLNKKTPYEKTAESWEISCNQNGICKVKNGEYKGELLTKIYEDLAKKEMIFGTNCSKYKEFPILIKFIDALDNLSIQVHPDDNYARAKGFEYGKTEMWYIIDCGKEAKLIAGMNKKLTKSELKDIIENNRIKEYLKYQYIKPGDSVFIPAGTLHAILKDTLICEIQQNSDITYRVYDWDRIGKDGKGRPLHKEDAINTINSEYIPEIIHSTNEEDQVIVSNKLFEVSKIVCKDTYENKTCLKSFEAFCVVKGEGKIDGSKIGLGDSFIIPASYGKYKIEGNIELLKTVIM